jgi:Protein of unknown function (DUF2934)
MTASKRSRNSFGSRAPVPPPQVGLLLETDLKARIEELAYYKAEARGFELGHALDDWVEAERELEQYPYKDSQSRSVDE